MAKITLNKNKTQKIISAVVAVIAALAIAFTAYCLSTKQNPVQAARSVFTASSNKIVGKWQSQEKPGLSAFVFYDDGTYDSYISTVNFSGEYTLSGSKLTLVNPTTEKTIVYDYSVTEKELSLKLIEEEGEKPEESTVSKYDKVDELRQKSFTDILGDLGGNQDTTEAEE